MKSKFFDNFIGEVIGTFIMVLFGTGSVAVSVLFNSHAGLFQIAIIWSIAVTLAIYMTRHICCAHFNPAVSIAMVLSNRMDKKRLPVYLLGQFVGAFLASLVVYLLFSPSIALFEQTNNIVRGSFESITTAKMFGEYYIQPGSTAQVSMLLACAAEFVGTFLLVLIIFLFTEGCNLGRPTNDAAPPFIGLTVGSIICLVAPLTQAGLNPARDFSPRITAYLFGWGKYAFPDATGGFFFVYILAPILGGIVASLLFTKFLEPKMKKHSEITCDDCEL